MDFITFLPFLNKFQALRKRMDDVALAPGAVIPMVDSARTPWNFLDLDGSSVSRLTYPELDAQVGLQGDMLSIERLTMPGGFTGVIYFIGNAWSTNDGGIIYWNGTALAKETICGLSGTIVAYYEEASIRGAVAIVPVNGDVEAHYTYWRNTGSGWVEVTPITVSTPTSDPLHIANYDSTPGVLFAVSGTYPVASKAGDGFFYLLMQRDSGGLLVFQWYVSGDSISYYGGAKRLLQFISPAVPYLTEDNISFALPSADYEGLPSPFSLSIHHENNSSYTSDPICPFAVHGSILGALASYGYAAPPVIATNQYSTIQATGRPGTLLMKRLSYDASKGYAVGYGSSFGFTASGTTSFPTESTVWFIGGAWHDETTYTNTPILMASFGLRNWHPITHSSFSDLYSFSNGFPVVDDNYSAFNTTLMEAMMAADASSVIYKIRANATCSITLPTEAASGGFKRVMWPGRKLPSSYTGGGSGGGSNPS